MKARLQEATERPTLTRRKWQFLKAQLILLRRKAHTLLLVT